MSEKVFDAVMPKVVQTIRAANALAAQDINFYKSLDADVAARLDNSAKELLHIVNVMMELAAADSKEIAFGKEDVTSEASWKHISNSLDNLFEKVDIEFDKAQRVKTAQKNTLIEEDDGATPHVTSKPQASFKVPVDTSELHPFKPKITAKPHALIPYQEAVQLRTPTEPTIGDDGEELLDPPYYPHPYEHEIDVQPYPEAILTKSEVIPPKEWESTSAIWVDTVDKLNKMIADLRPATEIAVDLEHHDYRSYYGIVCLMQISDRHQDWIVDTIALRDDLEGLNEIFANPHIIKVFHGAFMDIIWLQRDLGLYVVSLFDTYHASKKLGFPKFSLAYLLETFANFTTSKKYQLADWRLRPLTPPMLAYARSDTHFLLSIFDQLKNKLLDEQDKLQQVLYNSRQVAKRRFEYTSFRPCQQVQLNVSCPVMANNPSEPYASVLYQYNVPFEKKALVAELYFWRDRVARAHDESVRYVMANQVLAHLATLSKPITPAKVLGVSPHISDFVRHSAKELAELIDQTLTDISANEQSFQVVEGPVDEEALDVKNVVLATAAFETMTEPAVLRELISSDSLLFTKPLSKRSFSVEFTNNKVIKHTYTDYAERLKYAYEQWAEEQTQAVVVPSEPVEEAPRVEEAEETEEPPLEEIRPDDVIALRKRPVHTPKAKETSQEPSFDYESADKILIEVADKRREKKKRSFDPYGKISEGPQGAKKQKKIVLGRSETFSKRRR